MKTQEKTESAKTRRRRKNPVELVEKAIDSFRRKLEGDEVRASVGDFIRLLELEKQLNTDQPREIKVTWVEPTESASEK